MMRRSLRGIMSRVDRLAGDMGAGGPTGRSAVEIALGQYLIQRASDDELAHAERVISERAAPDRPRLSFAEECKAVGLSPEINSETEERLCALLASFEAEAGGPDAFAFSLGQQAGWTWRGLTLTEAIG